MAADAGGGAAVRAVGCVSFCVFPGFSVNVFIIIIIIIFFVIFFLFVILCATVVPILSISCPPIAFFFFSPLEPLRSSVVFVSHMAHVPFLTIFLRVSVIFSAFRLEYPFSTARFLLRIVCLTFSTVLGLALAFSVSSDVF